MTRIQHSALALIVTVLANVGASPLATAQTAELPLAHTEAPAVIASSSTTLEETFAQADERFQAADYADAAVLFTRVWQLAQTPEHSERWSRYTAIFAFNTATSYRLAHDCEAAHIAFSHYVESFEHLSSQQQAALRDATDLPLDNSAWLNDLTKECPRVPAPDNSASAPQPADSQDAGIQLANPQAASPQASDGTELSAQAAGNWLLDVNVPTIASATPAHPVDTTADTQPAASSRLGWVLASAGAVSLGASGYFLWSGIQNNNNTTATANKHAPYKDYTALRNRDYVTAGILSVLGLGLAGVGVYVLGTQNQESDTTQGITHRKLWLFASGTQVGVAGEL